jgi:hypothetical protein
MAGPSHLKPGENGHITLKVNTAGKKGPVVEYVEVESNDPLHPKVTLTIKAFVTDAGETIELPPGTK